VHTHSFRRLLDRALKLLGGHDRDRLRTPSHQLAEIAVAQRPVMEVRPQRDDHANGS
jgi:hypothetical protein